MGWASGADIANELWDRIRFPIPRMIRREIAAAIVDALEGGDWDTQDEAPLLMADAGRPVFEGEGPPCGKHDCEEPSAWQGFSGNLSVVSCNEHVYDIQGAEMLS